MLLRNRKWWVVSGVLLSAVLLLLMSGCAPSPTQATTTESMLEGNWWQRNVVYWFSLMLDTFADWFNGSYGLSILLLTIIVRTLILPLMIKQYKNTKAMQKLQPEIMKLREKHKDNPQKMQEEMMRLYQEHQVNPLAGCFPLLIQMPIFIALYNSIYMNSAIRTHSFLGLELGLAPSQSGTWYYYLVPVVAALTTFIQSWMMVVLQPQQQMGPMKVLMFIFPIMIFVMALSFPVALPLYWIYSNLYTIVQNYFMYGRDRSSKPEVTSGKEAKVHAKAGGVRKNGRRSAKKRS